MTRKEDKMMEQKLKSSFFDMAGWGRTVVPVALAILLAHALCAAEIAFTGAGARSSLSF